MGTLVRNIGAILYSSGLPKLSSSQLDPCGEEYIIVVLCVTTVTGEISERLNQSFWSRLPHLNWLIKL